MTRSESTHPRQGLSSFPHPVHADYTTPFEKEKGIYRPRLTGMHPTIYQWGVDRESWIVSGFMIRLAVMWMAISTTITVAGALFAGWVLIRMPADYFCEHHTCDFWPGKHPLLRWCGRIGKNLLGLLVIVAGVIMALPGVPGPGLLTILFGIMLLDIPGKRRLERWFISFPAVLSGINRLRHRHNKPPVDVEPTSLDAHED